MDFSFVLVIFVYFDFIWSFFSIESYELKQEMSCYAEFGQGFFEEANQSVSLNAPGFRSNPLE
jgi:hypothetical protein